MSSDVKELRVNKFSLPPSTMDEQLEKRIRSTGFPLELTMENLLNAIGSRTMKFEYTSHGWTAWAAGCDDVWGDTPLQVLGLLYLETKKQWQKTNLEQ